MEIPDHLTCLLRNLYAGQEATVGTGRGSTDWFHIRKGVSQGCILRPCLFNFYRMKWKSLSYIRLYIVHAILQASILESVVFLQGIFPTQGLNPGLPHCRQILHQLSHQGSPMQSTSCEMSRLLGEIAITSDMQMTSPLWQKVKKN